MAHLVFVVMHGAAALMFWPALLLTVGLHLIYGAARSGAKREPIPGPATHGRCGECHELVLKTARRCKHCGATFDQP